ncbi:hypothetical protein Ahu01nite_013470 [Winogradskya humida]|uniref:Uncharacterized protein n=1 Tax=Winogradskya humida TaxID=113566 RepID=A0ABQ3ZI30_9ACTN|nr:hypothetical protein Ahu01nite_013470 [Actinoplanes humidus]
MDVVTATVSAATQDAVSGQATAGPAPTGHARPATTGVAIRVSATHIVIDRALTRAPDPVSALARINQKVTVASRR